MICSRALLAAILTFAGVCSVWASFFAFVGTLIRVHPSNHTGFSPWWLAGAGLAGLTLHACAAFFARPRRSLWLTAATALLTICGVAAADRWNVLVEYETWIKRGMPNRGT